MSEFKKVCAKNSDRCKIMLKNRIIVFENQSKCDKN